ncbi:Rrf2 family transcriptional regulator [Hydrogenoanaerobacterium sp.]|uniref:RrF2 family transcriptional regulator n=1 Tax=Hydrogenoanaerobacterium sp. TaxID=2953763 RepID=UPI0028984D48|nr:Rrf2 family transcriptional regulator [Hydrogenoanaerobacterium sp.]
MKMSTKGRYGLRLMLDIALNSGEKPVALKDVAARQEISEKYLEQIIIKLSKAELVRGTRGARGGYVLARKPEDISVGDILRVVEGNLSPVDCAECSGQSICARADSCITIDLWRDIKLAVESVVDNRSLADLTASYHRKNPENK